MEAAHVLVVDDEKHIVMVVKEALTHFGYRVTTAGSGAEALAAVRSELFDAAITDIRMPDMSGLDLLREIKRQDESIEVIVMTGYPTIASAVEALKEGAYDYLSKPFELDDLRLVIKNAAETIQLRRENFSLRRRIEAESSQRGTLIGNSEGMQRVRAMIEKVAETDATVLVRGESGTGKELVAREIHERNSVRHNGTFVAVKPGHPAYHRW